MPIRTYDLHGQWDYGNVNAFDSCPSGKCIRSHVNLTETSNTLSISRSKFTTFSLPSQPSSQRINVTKLILIFACVIIQLPKPGYPITRFSWVRPVMAGPFTWLPTAAGAPRVISLVPASSQTPSQGDAQIPRATFPSPRSTTSCVTKKATLSGSMMQLLTAIFYCIMVRRSPPLALYYSSVH